MTYCVFRIRKEASMGKAVFFVGGTLAALCLAGVASAVPAPQGAPFGASSCTNCRQQEPSVAGATTGGFLVVWEGSTAKDLHGVNGRLFAPAGTPQTADFAVAKNLVLDQYDT